MRIYVDNLFCVINWRLYVVSLYPVLMRVIERVCVLCNAIFINDPFRLFVKHRSMHSHNILRTCAGEITQYFNSSMSCRRRNHTSISFITHARTYARVAHMYFDKVAAMSVSKLFNSIKFKNHKMYRFAWIHIVVCEYINVCVGVCLCAFVCGSTTWLSVYYVYVDLLICVAFVWVC